MGHEYTPENTRITPAGGKACIICRREIKSRWNKRHPEVLRKGSARFRATHPERVRKALARWEASHRPERREYARQWRKRDPDRLAEKKKQDYEKHRDRRLASKRRYVEANRERISQKKHEAVRVRNKRLRAAVTNETVRRLQIYERDNWTCQLCRLPVDGALRFPHKLSATLDHVVPLALGGAHSPSNVQLAHYSCNMAKGTRLQFDPVPSVV